MLLDIRETVRNSKPLKYTLITLICIPFALVGIGSYFAGGNVNEVAEVEGVAITEYEVNRAYDNLSNQYRQMFGGTIPEGLLSEDAIRQQALDGLVTNIVVEKTVEDQKFAVGDETLGRAIRRDTRFHVDGKFSAERYQELVGRGLSSVAGYEESLRANAAISQFRAGVEGTSFQLPSESKRLESLSNQTRTIDYVRYSIDSIVEGVEIDDEQVSAYFDENGDNYMFPQRGKFQYIELKQADLAADIDVSDEEAEAYYAEFESDYVTTPEVREISHILFELADADDNDEVTKRSAELSAIKARIEAGEAFADVAKEVSEDIGSAQTGGVLGQLDTDPAYTGIEFINAAQALTEASPLSGVVKTQFGLHLINLDKFAAPVITPYEEVKEDIITQLKNNVADTEFSELRVSMEDNLASDPDNLEVAADASNTELKVTDWVDIETEGDPIFSDPRVLAAAFSDEVIGSLNNSEIIEIGPGHVVALRVLEHEEPRPKALDDVRDEITETLKREQAAETLDESVKEAVALMLKGTPVSKVAGDNPSATATSNEVLTRQSTAIDAAAVQEIYALAKPAEGKVLVKSVSMQNGDRVAYALKAVDTPEPVEGEEEAEGEIFNPRIGQAEMAAMIANLREKADVNIE